MPGMRAHLGGRRSDVPQAADQADDIFLGGIAPVPVCDADLPAAHLDLMLVFFGVLFFVALTITVILDRRARKHQEIEILKRVYAGFVPLPWLLATAIFLN